ncbi:hypothetical protein [Paraliomyxa miuraensis]|uniref:hypothetical protein n=1 Tax=Paraliomyxa miuraensis TaxID=376150 RepID=UPI00225168DE|nr:hypothetical protein [Paraliomyxa miuraensis]MCX4243916.1 hypothetical protein [Paraliomyxa miuraensis]
MKSETRLNDHGRLVTVIVACVGLTLGGVVMQGLGPRIAMAGDNKILPAHACQPEEDPEYTIFSARYLENDLGAEQTYWCPVLRDDTQSELEFVRVRVENRGSSYKRPECTVHSVSVGGTFTDSEYEESPSTTGFFSLEFPLNGFTEYDNGHFVIECTLGDEDRILSYRTNESP